MAHIKLALRLAWHLYERGEEVTATLSRILGPLVQDGTLTDEGRRRALVETVRHRAHTFVEHVRPGQEVSNGLQTNGCLLNGAWAGFLAREGFSVGLSMDGPAALHDAFRRSADGGATHARVERAFALLKERGVFVNLLCVLNARNAKDPDGVYDYFRGLGATHVQFLPFVAGRAGSAKAEAEPEAIGEFLCRVFDRWIREDVGRMVIQNIDEALRPIYGLPHALCVHRETCGEVAVLERDGGFYACDHFVDAEHLIGNLRERSLADLASEPRLIEFGNAKRDTLPRACRECGVLSSCNGGCPKDRGAAPPGEPGGTSRLCRAYTMFFEHSKPGLVRLAAHMRSGSPLREFGAR